MIDFRYHIVSLIAVFLALGLGVLMGTTFLEGATVDVLEGRIGDLSSRLDGSRQDVADLRDELSATEGLMDGLTAWVLHQRLAGRPVLLVFDGGGGEWRAAVQQGFVTAGGQIVGSVTFTDRLRAEDAATRQELVDLVAAIAPSFDPGADPARATLELLGARLLEPTGRALLEGLGNAGFLEVDRRGEGEWPPVETAIAGLASTHADDAPNPLWMASFSRGAATVSPVSVVSAAPDEFHAVQVLRAIEDPAPLLSTFDAAADDPTEAGAVLALEAAIAGQGGHFGRGEDLPYLPEPPATTPVPTPAEAPAA